jgi:hypothetical protein
MKPMPATATTSELGPPPLASRPPDCLLILAEHPTPMATKLEGALGSYLANELKLRLDRNRVVVNREVVVHPTDEGDSGERPDILIEAGSPDNRTTEGPVIRIPLEIEGSWHDDVSPGLVGLGSHFRCLCMRYPVGR